MWYLDAFEFATTIYIGNAKYSSIIKREIIAYIIVALQVFYRLYRITIMNKLGFFFQSDSSTYRWCIEF